MQRIAPLDDAQVVAWEERLEAQMVTSLQAVMDRIADQIAKIQVASAWLDRARIQVDIPLRALIAAVTTGPDGDDLPPPMTGELAIPDPPILPDAIPDTPALPPGQPYISPDDLASIAPLWQQQVAEQILPLVAQVFIDSAGNIRSQLLESVAPNVTVAMPRLGSIAAEQYLRQARNGFDEIGDHLWATARAQMSQGFDAGESIPQIADRLRQSAGLTARQGVLVARTSVIEASNAGSLQMAQASGLQMQKEWIATPDLRTRPTHLEADGQRVDLNEPFIVGGHSAMFPAAPTLPPSERYRCRCTQGYVMPDKPETQPSITPPAQDAQLAELPGTSGLAAEIEAPPLGEILPKESGPGFDLPARGEGVPPSYVRPSLRDAKTPRQLRRVWQDEVEAITGFPFVVDAMPRGISMVTAREYAEGTLQMFAQFPAARVDRIHWFDDAASSSYAQVRRGGHAIEFNMRYASEAGRPKFLAARRRDAAGWDTSTTSWGVRNDMSGQGVVYHEFTHILDIENTRESLHSGIVPLLIQHAQREGITDIDDLIKRQISSYATKNYQEMIAEAGADVMVNGAAASQLSRDIFGLLRAEYRRRGFEIRTGPALPEELGEVFPKAAGPRSFEERLADARKGYEVERLAPVRVEIDASAGADTGRWKAIDATGLTGPQAGLLGAVTRRVRVSGPFNEYLRFPEGKPLAPGMATYRESLSPEFRAKFDAQQTAERAKMVAAAQRDIKALDRAMAQSPLPDDIVVWRTGRVTGLPDGDAVGYEYTDPGYTGTTGQREIAASFSAPGRVISRILVPKDTPAINIYGGGEGELLLARDLRYRIVADRRTAAGVRELDIEVLPTPPAVKPAIAAPRALASQTVAQLRALAKERGITVPPGTRKADLVKMLEEAPTAPVSTLPTVAELAGLGTDRMSLDIIESLTVHHDLPADIVQGLVDDGIDEGIARGYLQEVQDLIRMRAEAAAREAALPISASFEQRMASAARGQDAVKAAPLDVRQEAQFRALAPDRSDLQFGPLESVQRYRGVDYDFINDHLRAGGGAEFPLVAGIDAAMDASVLRTSTLSFRGLSDRGFVRETGLSTGEDLTGATWTSKPYVSTGTDEAIGRGYASRKDATGVFMRIVTPEGTKAVSIGGGEAELLLQRGLTFRVVADHGVEQFGRFSHRVLDVEVVPAQPTAATARAAQRAEVRARAAAVAAQRGNAALLARVDELIQAKASKAVIRQELDPALRETEQLYAGADEGLASALRDALDSGEPAKLRAAVTRQTKASQITPIGKAGAKAKFDPDTMEGVGGTAIPDGADVIVVRRGAKLSGIETPEKAVVRLVGPKPLPPALTRRFDSALTDEGALTSPPYKHPKALNDAYADLIPDARTRRLADAGFRSYGGQGYEPINELLRSGGSLTGDGKYQEMVRAMDVAMDASPLPVDVIAWRSTQTGRSVFGDALSSDLTGFTWDESGFISTSVRRSGAEKAYSGKVLMRILVPRGTGAIQQSTWDWEAEMLLQRGLTLRVVADRGLTERGARLLDVEVVPKPRAALRMSPASTEKTVAKGDFTGLTRVSEPLGGNPGGIFEAGDGSRWYVKAAVGAEQARSEALALDLYRAAGLDAPELVIGQGVEGLGTRQVATRFLDDAKVDLRARLADDPAYIAEVQDGFAVDAWLANWDVVGANPAPGKGWDNIVSVAGRPVRIEAGGALEYRGLGGKKPFNGDIIGEFDTLRDPEVAERAAQIFGDMTPEQIVASAERVRKVTPAKIKALVKKHGLDPELADTLIARRADILRRADLLAGPKPMTPREFAVAVKSAAKKQDALDAVPAGMRYVEATEPGELGQTVWANLGTPATQDALQEYTAFGFQDANEALRLTIDDSTQAGRIGRDLVRKVDRAFDQSRLTHDVELWRSPGSGRGIFGDLGTWGDDLAGFEWSESAYSSTSAVRTVADRFVKQNGVRLRIIAREGSKAVKLSSLTGEAEILLARGARYRVVKDRGWTEVVHPTTHQRIRVRDLDVEVTVPDVTPPLPWETK